jgi:hypothetical protein
MAKDDALQALLAADINVEEDVFIKRLNVHFRVKAITGNTLDKLREQATHYVGKGANRKKQLDENEFSRLIIAEGCVSPDFSNPKLLEKYGATDAGDCVQKALLAGEIAKLSEKILEISGFADDDDDFEDVKN